MSIFIDPKDKPTAYNGHESFAFVSYCHADFPQLQPDFRELSSRYRVWYDEGLKSGEEWLEEIGARIYECDTFIVFLSAKALESRYIKHEISYAFKFAKRMIAVFLEPLTLPRSFEFILGPFQFVHWYHLAEGTDKMNKLTEGIPDSIRIPEQNSPAEARTDAGAEKQPAGISGSDRPRTAERAREDFDRRYEIIRTIGKGSFGEVKLVKSRQLGALYVMKHQQYAQSAPEENKLRKAVARNELQKLLLLSDRPYTPTVVDYLETDTDCCLVMNKIPGLNLRDILKTHRFEIDRDIALSLIFQTALMLRDVHRAGLVYGDLKPSNIILDPFGRLNLIDFGSAAAVGDRNYLRLKTPRYAAPEQSASRGGPDCRSDVYSLGVMLKELLNAGRPSPRLSDDALFADPWEQPAQTGGDPVGRICAKMTAASPGARYAGMGEVLAALELVCPQDSAEVITRFAGEIGDWEIAAIPSEDENENVSAPRGMRGDGLDGTLGMSPEDAGCNTVFMSRERPSLNNEHTVFL